MNLGIKLIEDYSKIAPYFSQNVKLYRDFGARFDVEVYEHKQKEGFFMMLISFLDVKQKPLMVQVELPETLSADEKLERIIEANELIKTIPGVCKLAEHKITNAIASVLGMPKQGQSKADSSLTENDKKTLRDLLNNINSGLLQIELSFAKVGKSLTS